MGHHRTLLSRVRGRGLASRGARAVRWLRALYRRETACCRQAVWVLISVSVSISEALTNDLVNTQQLRGRSEMPRTHPKLGMRPLGMAAELWIHEALR